MGKRVVVLGGTGKMGRWFARFLKDRGFDVAIHSRSPERAAEVARELGVGFITSIEDVREADMVLVSTSLASTVAVIRAVSRKLQPNTILFDIASVKGEIIEALHESQARGIRAISVHPMFGPGVTSLEGKRVVVIPIGEDAELVEEMTRLFEGAEIHLLDSGEVHDRAIAFTLSLPHFLNIVFGEALTGADFMSIRQLAGTTFALQLTVTEAVYSEDPDLYYTIQRQNKAFLSVLETFLETVRRAASVIARGDQVTFGKSFEAVRSFLTTDPNFADAYDRFYKAYEAIV